MSDFMKVFDKITSEFVKREGRFPVVAELLEMRKQAEMEVRKAE